MADVVPTRRVTFQMTNTPAIVGAALDARADLPAELRAHAKALIAAQRVKSDALDVVAEHGVVVSIHLQATHEGTLSNISVKRTPIGPPTLTRDEFAKRQAAKRPPVTAKPSLAAAPADATDGEPKPATLPRHDHKDRER